VNREPVAWPDRPTELSHPQWLLERWDRQYGAETAGKIAQANLNPPETWVRITAAPPPDAVLKPGDVPGAYKLVSGSTEGLRIQDIGSQAVVPLLDLEPGQTFLDLCAAPGNKTAQALESGVRAVACDRHWSRLSRLRAEGCQRVVLDGTRPLPFHHTFDRILVDAPCSGTGTLGRNPEIKWRLTPDDISDLHDRQTRLLGNALEHLSPGGRLVYSTCSLEREENEGVLEALGVCPAETMARIPGVTDGDGFFAAVIGR
jgi:16S rRNA (cytosine967-C5)-methyltransferase